MGSSKFIHALYNDDDVLMSAVKAVKAEKHYIEEIYTPFPVHGLDKAMRLKPTNISIATFFYGCIGFTVAVLMMYYIMILDWPQDIGGKPSFTLIENIPSFVPIIFEMTVFFAAHLMVITFYMRSKLWPFKEAENPDPSTTDDKFLIDMESGSNLSKTKTMLKKMGAISIKEVKEESEK